MTNELRDATKEEKGLAATISNKLTGAGSLVAGQAEDKGFRVLEKEDEYISILTPSGKIFDWDFEKRSLDNLSERMNKLELADLSVYAAQVHRAYTSKSLLFGN